MPQKYLIMINLEKIKKGKKEIYFYIMKNRNLLIMLQKSSLL